MSVQVLRPALYPPAVSLPAPFPKDALLPLSLAPTRAGASLPEITAEIRDLKASGKVQDLLDRHGAIYFQNLGLKSADEFSEFAHAFGWKPHEDIGNPVRRTILAKNVATANEGPNTLPVYPHNEFGLSPHYPAYVLFYCVAAPETGGETPINNSVLLYNQLKERHPEFIEELEKRGGVKYQLFHPNGPRDQTSSAGTTVLQAYGQHVLDTDDTETAREKIEAEIRRLPTATLEWVNQAETNPLGDLRIWEVLPAVRNHPRTGQPAFFNNVVSRFLNALKDGTLFPPHLTKDGDFRPPAFYGDGSLIPREYLDCTVEFINQNRSLITWKAGDVVLIDVSLGNFEREMLHPRAPSMSFAVAFRDSGVGGCANSVSIRRTTLYSMLVSLGLDIESSWQACGTRHEIQSGVGKEY